MRTLKTAQTIGILAIGFAAAGLAAGCKNDAKAKSLPRAPQYQVYYVDITSSADNAANGFGGAPEHLEHAGLRLVQAATIAPVNSTFEIYETGPRAGQPRQVATMTIAPAWTRSRRTQEVAAFAKAIEEEAQKIHEHKPVLGTSPVLEDLDYLADDISATNSIDKKARQADLDIVSDGQQYTPFLTASRILEASDDDQKMRALVRRVTAKYPMPGAARIHICLRLLTSQDDHSSQTRHKLERFYQALFRAEGFLQADISYSDEK